MTLTEVLTPNITLEQITRLAQLDILDAQNKHVMILNLGVVQYLGQHHNSQLRNEGYLEFRGVEGEEVVNYAIRKKDLRDTRQGIELMQDSLIGKVYDESHLLEGNL